MPVVALPDGREVEFPEGASPEQMRGAILRDFPGLFPGAAGDARAGRGAGLRAEQARAAAEGESLDREFARELAPEREPLQSGGARTQAGIGLLQGFSQVGQQGNRLLELATDPLNPSNIIMSGGLSALLAKVFPDASRALTRQFRGAADTAAASAKEWGELGQEVAGPELARQMGAGAASLLPSLAAAPLGFGAMVASAGMQGFAGTLDEAEAAYQQQNAALTREQARTRAYLPALASGAATAGVTALFGRTGIEALQNPAVWRGVKAAAAATLKEGAQEGAEEWWDQLAQAAIAKLSYRPDLTVAQALQEASVAGLAGALVGAPVAGVQQASAYRPADGGGRTAATTRATPDSPELVVNQETGTTEFPAPTGETSNVQRPTSNAQHAPASAVFRGPNGEDIRVELGGATLEQAQSAIFRQQPGAEFVGVESGPGLAPGAAAESGVRRQETGVPAESDLGAKVRGEKIIEEQLANLAAQESALLKQVMAAPRGRALDELQDRRAEVAGQRRALKLQQARLKVPAYDEIRGIVTQGIGERGLGHLPDDISEFVLYRGEAEAPRIVSVGEVSSDLSRISNSFYPVVELVLDNGAKKWVQIRVSDHGQVSRNSPYDYSHDVRFSGNPKRAGKYVKKLQDAIADDLQSVIDVEWADQREVLQKANAPVAGGAAGIKTPLGSPEAGKGSVSALQPEGASALTGANQPGTPPAVKPPAATGATAQNPEFVGKLTSEDLKVGDVFQTSGDKRVAPVGGTITKVNPKTVVIQTEYMGKPMTLTLRKDGLTGEIRIKRDGKYYSSEHKPKHADLVAKVRGEMPSEFLKKAAEHDRAAGQYQSELAAVDRISKAHQAANPKSKNPYPRGPIIEAAPRLGAFDRLYEGVERWQANQAYSEVTAASFRLLALAERAGMTVSVETSKWGSNYFKVTDGGEFAVAWRSANHPPVAGTTAPWIHDRAALAEVSLKIESRAALRQPGGSKPTGVTDEPSLSRPLGATPGTVSGESAPERGGTVKPDFSLAPAESVAQQTARLAQEQAGREAKAQQDAERNKLAELQAKPLAGTAGDLGQGDLLAAPDDLFAPPTPQAKTIAEAVATPDAVAATLLDEAADPVAAKLADIKADEADKFIEDFGEKIVGARKDLWATFKKRASEALPADAADITISSAFPEPDYEEALRQGVPMESLATFKALRDMVPAKPRQSWKLERWVELVRGLHALTSQLVQGQLNITPERLAELVNNRAFGRIAQRVRLYRTLGYPAFTQAKDWSTVTGSYSVYRSQQFNPPKTITSAEHKGRSTDLEVEGSGPEAEAQVAELIRRKIAEAASQPKADDKVEFKLFKDRLTGDIFIGKKAVNGVVRLKTGFKSVKEARQFIADQQAELEAQWAGLKAHPEYRRAINLPRQGPVRREGDVSPQLFQDAFGFRGVQFGNWVESDRRQVDLNEAFDALMDMAQALGVPPKALSLDGSLGLAFGARGTAGAKAHYEPGEVVINITKKSGPGSLAHEWFHAVDNYFARLDRTGKTEPKSLDAFATSNLRPAVNLRPEVAAAFKRVREVLGMGTFAARSGKLDEARSKAYYGTTIEKAARAFEQYVVDRLALAGISNDYLVNLVKDESPALPTQAEMDGGIRQAFDALFEAVEVVPDVPTEVVDAKLKSWLDQHSGRPGMLYANPFLNPKFWQAVAVSGARMLRDLGQFTVTQAKWSAAMLKKFGQGIQQALAATWNRLMRLQTQQTNGVSAIGQGHLNQIEAASVNANIAEEQKPVYSEQDLAKGAPGLGIRLQPMSKQIAFLGGKALLGAKQKLDVTGALQAAAVKKQSDNLWQQLVESSAAGNPLTKWKLPAWLIGTPRAQAFKTRVLHIAARLNATGRATDDHFAEPPLAPGMVRLYRGESGRPAESSKLGTLLDPEQYRGRWFTTDKDYAARYAKTATEASGYRMKPADNGELVFVDVPATTDLNQFEVPPADRWRTSLSGSSELILPAEMLGQAKRLKWSRAGNFTFADFTMRAGTMSLGTARESQLSVGDQFTVNDPLTGITETLTLGPIITTPEGRVFHQLARPVDGATQAELYQHFAREYPEMIWFLDMFIDPALAGLRQTINGIEVPVFNRFAAAAMMADGNPNFSPLTAYTPDVLITRSLLGAIRGAWHKAGVRSSGRKYKSGTSREGGHVRDLLSGFNVRTWQMLQEKSRREWMQAVLQSATPIRQNQVPEGWVKLETGMEELWQAVKRLRNWKSPVDPATGAALFPETEQRAMDDGSAEYKAFFLEAMKLRGKQLMLPQTLVDQLVRKYVAHVEHGTLYRLGSWLVRNSTQLFLVAPVTVVNNVLTNDMFTLQAATRRILSGVAGGKMQDLRFARELFTAEFFKWFPGLRTLVDPQWRATLNAGVLPENLFADQTMLADLKVRLDEDPLTYLRQGEIGAAALNFIRYGQIDTRAKTRMAYAWLRAQAVTNARKAGLRGAALRAAVDAYLARPPVADMAAAVEVAGFELLNYADSPAWLEDMASGKFSAFGGTADVGDFGRLVMPFPRFGYHFIAKTAREAAAVKVLLGKVPKGQRADAFADLITFLMWPAGGLGILAAYGLKGLGDDDDEARKRVGTASIKTVDADGNMVSKPLPRDLITSNRINLSAWARGLGLGTDREEDFWLRVRSYPVIAMAGAALLAEEDARKFGAAEGAQTYAVAVKDLALDFFSVGMAVKVPSKVLNDLGNTRHERTFFDPYASGVPTVAYVVDQTLDSFLPGTRQFDIAVKWMDPIARRRGASKTLGFDPTVWDAARVGHVTGLMDRLFAGEAGTTASTLPPEGKIERRSGTVPVPQEYSLLQRYAELGGFNLRPIDRNRYEEALAPAVR